MNFFINLQDAISSLYKYIISYTLKANHILCYKLISKTHL